MQYTIETDFQLLSNAPALVFGVFEDSVFPQSYEEMHPKTSDTLKQLRASIPNEKQWISHLTDNKQIILLVNLGVSNEFTHNKLKKCIQQICDYLTQMSIEKLGFTISFTDTMEQKSYIKHALRLFDESLYQFNHFKSSTQNNTLKHVSIYSKESYSEMLSNINAINHGIRMTRDLANTPANICTPSYLAATAQELSQQYAKISCKVLGVEDMRSLGMGALLAVAAGSEQEPKLIELNYNNAGNNQPIVIVGKGITFDSGGLCIKPGAGMQEMKYDMCGAASVLGVMKACAEMKLNVNLIGIVASAENMISGKATKPGDVVTTMSGQSVEIINTDAEGRLVLADALTYAEQFNPEFVIDIATLTGAMVVALGSINTGLMTQDEDLANAIIKAGNTIQDRCWRMPLEDEYQSAIDSSVADMLNGAFDRSAGGITAACFLSRFTAAYRWAHLDIAGTAWISGKKCNATGRPVSLLIELIEQHCNAR